MSEDAEIVEKIDKISSEFGEICNKKRHANKQQIYETKLKVLIEKKVEKDQCIFTCILSMYICNINIVY